MIRVAAVSLILLSSLRAEDLTVLTPGPDRVTSDVYLENWLAAEVARCIDRRSEAFETMIKSANACRQWQEERRAFFFERIGGLPERTPLKAEITGTLEGEGYRVEKILLETRPGFHLTANLYLPATPGPWPAVLVPCGHSHNGKAAGQYQLASRLLSRHGLAAICYDPIGQGERYQILDPETKRTHFDDAPHVEAIHPSVKLMCTTEHTMVGLSSALLGENVAQYRIWDGMRVIDYLQSRPDILADKIGCTGNSGGGTETAYLMALDDRIVAAAPGCYLTTFRSLLSLKGPQDGEQNIFGQLAFGMDQADYCIMRLPKPTLIAAGTRDVTFDFAGTWDLFRDAKRFASRIGHPDSIDLAAPDAPHGFTLQLREAVTRFMLLHLAGKDVEVREVPELPDAFSDEELRALTTPDWTDADLQVTKEGQVLLRPGERSVFQINAESAARWKAERAKVWTTLDVAGKQALVRKAIGDERNPDKPTLKTVGELKRGDLSIRKLVLEVAPGLPLPGLSFHPDKPDGRVVLYLHGESMKADAGPGGPIERLAREGAVVHALELRGIGETQTGFRRKAFGTGRFGPDNLEILTAYLIGKSYTGMRAADLEAWVATLGIEKASLVALGEAAIPALHAAALNPDRFSQVTLRGMIPSWESLAAAPETHDQMVNLVHGVLRQYDLPDLVEMAGAKRVKVERPVDGLGNPVD
jgi:pimeloyl-ACP methyl ester carboxylesterase